MTIPYPVFVMFITGSDGTVKHTFASSVYDKLIYLSIKPGLTNTIGSFELKIPDINETLGTAGAFSDVDAFDDLLVYLGYTNTGSLTFAGKIETIKSGLSLEEGYTRTFLGSDYGECLSRVLVNRGFKNLSGDTIIQWLRNQCTGSTTGGLSTSNSQMVGDTDYYTLTANQNQVFDNMKKLSDSSLKDFFVGTDKVFHYFNRQSSTGSETFSVGTNILEYTITKDLNSVRNDIYVFGIRNPSNTSGSDVPVNHDDWTENVLSGWAGWIISSGVPEVYNNECDVSAVAERQSGSYSVLCDTGSLTTPLSSGSFYLTLTKTLPDKVYLTDEDFVHFFTVPQSLNEDISPQLSVELHTNLGTDYFSCKLDSLNTITPTWESYWDYTISVGPNYEGTSTTGSKNTSTGSYLWERVGEPDWLNINYVKFVLDCYEATAPTRIGIGLDNFYFGTKYYSHKSGSSSISTYGLRKLVEIGEYNSNDYCSNVASTLTGSLFYPITQVELSTTGSYNLSLGSTYFLTIPADGINDYYELIDLEHTLDSQGAISRCLFTDKKELRAIIPTIKYETQYVQINKEIEHNFYSHFGGTYPLNKVIPNR